jgi:DNA-binding beta-propeller fold protein YncE
VNPATNQGFVSSFDSGIITVIDGANSATNQVYVTNPNVNTVTLIDGATFTTSTLTDPNAKGPAALAINSAVGEVYVAMM